MPKRSSRRARRKIRKRDAKSAALYKKVQGKTGRLDKWLK